jgi:hypothetical protein
LREAKKNSEKIGELERNYGGLNEPKKNWRKIRGNGIDKRYNEELRKNMENLKKLRKI